GGGRRAAQAARSRAARPRASSVLTGGDLVTERVGAHTWQIPVTGFWQAHRAAPLRYAQTVQNFVAQAAPDGRLRVWDLYGGAGVLGAGLLARTDPGGVEIDLVESDHGAVAAARRALADEPVHIHRGEVGATIAGLPRPDVVVADPPRKGAGAAVIAAIAAAEPRIVVHVGCDAAAFARDLRDYRRHGFRVADWRAFDAFPLTHHMEAIALLVSP
ncbi:putative RNA methyltransferase, partial [Gordonia hirsuta DSM 44140 = NBRC 16056]